MFLKGGTLMGFFCARGPEAKLRQRVILTITIFNSSKTYAINSKRNFCVIIKVENGTNYSGFSFITLDPIRPINSTELS